MLFFSTVLLTASALSQPQFKIILKGGYSAPVADLKGAGADSADLVNSYIMNGGFNGGIDIKYFLGHKRNLGITIGASYNSFSSGEFDATRFYSSTTIKDTGVEKRKMNIIQAGIGAEYDFSPRESTNPYAGIELSGYMYSGNAVFNPKTGGEKKLELKSATRFGLALGGGVDIKFNKYFGASVGLKYHIANLIGKKSDAGTEVNTTTGTEYELNDKEYNINDVVYGKKNISFIQLTAGVTLLLNEPKRTIRK